MNRTLSIAAAALLVVALILGRSWIALGVHAASYPVTRAGEASNVAIDGDIAYASLGERGVELIDLLSGRSLGVVPPPAGSESIDDLAIADHYLFALDARPPGHLSVFSLASAHPTLVSPPVDAEVGPFSGVSAAAGRVIVSGGTSLMTLRNYDGNGKLSAVVATLDCGRGQPDVLLAADGQRAFVSTHYWGPYFGLTTVAVGPSSLVKTGALSLDTYGFTDGGAKPANFPIETALSGGDVLLLADAGGLNVISVADLRSPRTLARIDVGVKAVNVDVRDGLAAVVGSSPKPLLTLVDVSAPAIPRIVRSIPLPQGSYPTGVAIGLTHIAVACHRHGVLRFPK